MQRLDYAALWGLSLMVVMGPVCQRKTRGLQGTQAKRGRKRHNIRKRRFGQAFPVKNKKSKSYQQSCGLSPGCSGTHHELLSICSNYNNIGKDNGCKISSTKEPQTVSDVLLPAVS